MSIFGRPKTEPVPEFALCEPVTATTLSREHIRRVGPEGIKPGGGIPDNEHGTALCGYSVARGWDLPGREVGPAQFDPDAETNPTCRGCITAWEAETGIHRSANENGAAR